MCGMKLKKTTLRGGTFAGLPAFGMGRNSYFAWVLTMHASESI